MGSWIFLLEKGDVEKGESICKYSWTCRTLFYTRRGGGCWSGHSHRSLEIKILCIAEHIVACRVKSEVKIGL